MVRQACKRAQKACRKAVEALPAIVGSFAGAILSFLGKAVGFIAEHTWALIVICAEFVGWWQMQKVRKNQVFAGAYHINQMNIKPFYDLIKVTKV